LRTLQTLYYLCIFKKVRDYTQSSFNFYLKKLLLG